MANHSEEAQGKSLFSPKSSVLRELFPALERRFRGDSDQSLSFGRHLQLALNDRGFVICWLLFFVACITICNLQTLPVVSELCGVVSALRVP